MAGGPAICGIGRPFGQGNTAFDEACGASSPPAAKAALALAARQIVPPTVVLGTSHLGVDEAVDALVGDHLAGGRARPTPATAATAPRGGGRPPVGGGPPPSAVRGSVDLNSSVWAGAACPHCALSR